MRHLIQCLPAVTLTLASGFFCFSAASAQEHLVGQQPAANRVIKLRSSLVPAPPAPTTVDDSSSSRPVRTAENASAPAGTQYDGNQASTSVPAVLQTTIHVPPRVAEQTTVPQKPIVQSQPVQQTTALSYSSSKNNGPATATTKPMSVTQSGPAINTLIEAPGYINLNQTATLRIKLQNVGDTSAKSVKLIATLPAHAKFSRATPTPTRVAGQKYEFQLSNLGAQQTREVTVELIPTEKIGLNIGTEVVVENTQRIAVGVRQPKIKLSLLGPSEANMGQSLTHKVLLENTGDGIAQDIQLVADFPEQLQCSKKDRVTIPVLQPGQSVVVKLPTLCKSAGQAELNVSVAAVGVDSQSVKANVTIRQPELEVSAVGPQMNFVNREGLYTIKLDNTGEVDASNVKIQLKMPRGMKVTTISREATVDTETGVLVWNFDRIPAKTEQSIMLKTLATVAGEQVCHVTVQSSETREKVIQLSTLVATRPDLSLSVKNQSGPIQVGGKAQFLIKVENKGSSSAEDVSIVVELPESFTANQQDGVELFGFANAVNFQDAKIEPGQKHEFVFSAIANSKGEYTFRGVLATAGTERKITVEDSVYVYEVSEMRVSESLSPAIPR